MIMKSVQKLISRRTNCNVKFLFDQQPWCAIHDTRFKSSPTRTASHYLGCSGRSKSASPPASPFTNTTSTNDSSESYQQPNLTQPNLTTQPIHPTNESSRLWADRPAEPMAPKKPKSSNEDTLRYFVDFKRVLLTAGNGGDGRVAFRRVKYNAHAGPYGGDGGNGGHVILEADVRVTGLNHLQESDYKADDGVWGSIESCHGANAEHLVLTVPVGTQVRDAQTGRLLAELKRHGRKLVVVRGGAGGKGNEYFASATKTVPDMAEPGGTGQARDVVLDLKYMAHVGFLGYPNVGKSSLLRAISRARPKVAAYPFTTLNPYVGIVDYDDHVRLAFADIPGILPGYHNTHDLGHSFLKHLQRCICLLYVIDLSLDEPWRQIDALREELERFEPGLSRRPHAIVANKADLEDSAEKLEILRSHAEPLPVFPISAKFKVGVREMLLHVRQIYDQNKISWFDE